MFGDHFFDYLVNVKVAEPNLLRRDSLNSIQTWNALFNPSQRTRFANKTGPIKKLIKELNNLSDEIPHQKWIDLFLQFLSTFNPKIFRQQDSIKKFERRILYEMLERIVKEAGSVLFEMIKMFGNSTSKRIIESFNLIKVHRSKVIFKFSTSSAAEDKQLTKIINTYIEKSAEPIFDILSQYAPGADAQKPTIDMEYKLEPIASERTDKIFSECIIGTNGQEDVKNHDIPKILSSTSPFLSLEGVNRNQFEYQFNDFINLYFYISIFKVLLLSLIQMDCKSKICSCFQLFGCVFEISQVSVLIK